MVGVGQHGGGHVQVSGVKLCKRGHRRTPENVDGGGHCKACDRERQRERWRTDPAYRERRLKQMSEWYYSDDPRIHRLILGARVRADIKAREQRVAKRREARLLRRRGATTPREQANNRRQRRWGKRSVGATP